MSHAKHQTKSRQWAKHLRKYWKRLYWKAVRRNAKCDA